MRFMAIVWAHRILAYKKILRHQSQWVPVHLFLLNETLCPPVPQFKILIFCVPFLSDHQILNIFQLVLLNKLNFLFVYSKYHTLYPGCNIFVYIADQKQPNTSRARMDCGKSALFLLLQTLKTRSCESRFCRET